ncbi:MAG: HdeD family acid-resistance protein [Euryarchaeota archaeon]|nr:HdeD family acid-resistance protein [Euryarchaeota archaeon]
MATQWTKDRWWGRVIFGVIALLIGLAIFVVPGITLTLFIWLFGAFMLLSGVILLSYAWSRPKGSRHRTLNFAEGGINIIIGIIALFAPGLSALFLVYLVAIFAIISGILQIAEGVVSPAGRTTLGTSNRWLLVVSGAWALLIGVLIALFPGGGILALLWIVGIFLMVMGVFNILSGIRARPIKMPTPAR